MRIALVMTFLFAGCGGPEAMPTEGTSPSAPLVFTLPTSPFAAPGATCAGFALVNATLVGNPDDPRLVWLEINDSTEQMVAFPPGYTAWFTPDLEVHDTTGALVLHGGDQIEGACGSVDGRYLLTPPWP